MRQSLDLSYRCCNTKQTNEIFIWLTRDSDELEPTAGREQWSWRWMRCAGFFIIKSPFWRNILFKSTHAHEEPSWKQKTDCSSHVCPKFKQLRSINEFWGVGPANGVWAGTSRIRSDFYNLIYYDKQITASVWERFQVWILPYLSLKNSCFFHIHSPRGQWNKLLSVFFVL